MSETVKGLYAGLVLNLVVAAVLNNTAFEPSARTWLVTLGAANELLGVLMVASPELIPRAAAVWRFLKQRAQARARRAVDYVRRLLGLPGRTHAVSGMLSTGIDVSDAVSAIVGPPANATTEELVRYLIRQDKRHQERLSAIEKEIEQLPKRWRGDIDEARAELRDEQTALERRIAEARIHLRLLGLLYVVIGIVLSWLGNVV